MQIPLGLPPQTWGNVSRPVCTFKHSLVTPLWNPHQSAPNPCFLASIMLLAYTFIGILIAYQILVVLFNNKFGPFPIKYSFGRPLLVRSVGLGQLLRLHSTSAHAVVLVALASINFSSTTAASVKMHSLSTLAAVTVFLALPLHFLESTRSIVASASLLVYWLVSFVLLVLVLLNDVFSPHKLFIPASDKYTTSLSLTCEVFLAANALIVFVLEHVFYKPSHELTDYFHLNDWKPQAQYNLVQKLLFTWINPLLNHAYNTDSIELEDVPPILIDLKSEVLVPRFRDQWAILTAKAAAQNEQIAANLPVKLPDPENPEESSSSLQKVTPSLFFTLFRLHWGRILSAVVLGILEMCCTTIVPFLLQKFIVFFTQFSQGKGTEDAPPFIVGVSWAVSIYLVSVVRYFSFNQMFIVLFKTQFAVESVLSTISYEKALLLSPEARRIKNTGEIVNHVSADVRDISGVLEIVSDIITTPLRLALCLFALYKLLGNSTWAGLAVSLVMVPLSSLTTVAIYTLFSVQMEYKDERTRLTSEILNSIKSIKLYSWERPMMKRLEDIRNNKELQTVRKIGIYNAGATFLWECIPFFISCAVYGVFGYFRKVPLTPSIVFPALSLFDLLTEPLFQIPSTLSQIAECKVSLSRVQSFFSMDEMDENIVKRTYNPLKPNDVSIKVEKASFVWSSADAHKKSPEDVTYALKNIDFTARKAQLSCIVGRVGSGKTTLLKALVGEIPLITNDNSSVNVNGTIAYCAQNPWVLNSTVRENILFGKRYDKDFYQRTIEACQLTHDFSVLPDGDSTIVGEKGISLSGGQKARLSLARAVYSRADIYLLDDVLSAVDAHVGKRIILAVLSKEGMLGSKTIVLATNAIHVLKSADEIVFLQKGEIVERGTFKLVSSSGGLIAQMVAEHESNVEGSPADAGAEADNVTGNDADQKHKNQKNNQTEAETVVDTYESSDDNEARPLLPAVAAEFEDVNASTVPLAKVSTHATIGQASAVSFDHEYEFEDDFGKQRREEEQKEKSEQGHVKLEVFLEFLKACRWPIIVAYVVLYWVVAGLAICGRLVLKQWSERNMQSGHNVQPLFYLALYASTGVIGGVVTFLSAYLAWSYSAFYSSKYFHDNMANGVLRSPMSFFDTTPIGRIMNRFSHDISVLDNQILWILISFFQLLMETVIRIGIVIYNLPFMSVIVLLLSVVYIYYRNRYIPGSRELTRLRSKLRSPVISHLQESVNGLETLRAYGENPRFIHSNRKKLDAVTRANFVLQCSNRWLSMRLQSIATFIVLTASILVLASLFTDSTFSPGMVGFLMTYVFSSTSFLNAIIRYWSDLETRFVSVERLVEYSNLPSEAPEVIELSRPAESWPDNGGVVFSDYSTRYREGLDPVLKNISLDIKPLEKIGIVGRTGAGKSSLTLALFRIIEATSGSIAIDKVDTSTIGLFDLRSNLNIIPQDAHAFEGSVRENLDPFEQYSDEQLWKVLELAHLKEHVEAMKTEEKPDDGSKTKKKKNVEDNKPQVGLRAKVLEGGSNLSAGQKQLLCLARALLKDSRVLVLDEATAAVDVQTDKIIQETIRSEFKDKTILTIAHRLETIMDSDRVLVLDKGEVAEFDSVPALLGNKEGIFYSLCKEGGFLN